MMKLIVRISGCASVLVGMLLGQTQQKVPTMQATALKNAPKPKLAPKPIGVQVLMSDGTFQTYPLGPWLMFTATPSVRVVLPAQYVDQIAVLLPSGVWKYPQPGRNVQIWRNGMLQRLGADYTLDQRSGTIRPIKYQQNGGMVDWNPEDYVTAAYLF